MIRLFAEDLGHYPGLHRGRGSGAGECTRGAKAPGSADPGYNGPLNLTPKTLHEPRHARLARAAQYTPRMFASTSRL
jgi:hypothetical protein